MFEALLYRQRPRRPIAYGIAEDGRRCAPAK
jgi:hypothetical protein